MCPHPWHGMAWHGKAWCIRTFVVMISLPEVQYSVKDARDGSVAKVALQCTDVRTRMSDNVTLCSPVMGVRDRVNGSFREGRKEGREE